MHALLTAMAAPSVRFDGLFTTTSASSPVTSATRTVTTGGNVKFNNVMTDSGTPQYSKNAGAYANITEGLSLSLAVSDTLAVRCTLPVGGQTASFSISRPAGGAIESVTLTKS